MESTGIYWQPIYEILEDAFSGDITLLVVNARHMRNVPGRNIISYLIEHGQTDETALDTCLKTNVLKEK